MATVMDPDMRHTRNPTGKAQEVLPGSTMLIGNQETLVSRVTLEEKEQNWWVWWCLCKASKQSMSRRTDPNTQYSCPWPTWVWMAWVHLRIFSIDPHSSNPCSNVNSLLGIQGEDSTGYMYVFHCMKGQPPVTPCCSRIQIMIEPVLPKVSPHWKAQVALLASPAAFWGPKSWRDNRTPCIQHFRQRIRNIVTRISIKHKF